jgi:poly(ribitol-phosphate) beta-N-acetylglucosaminyltransferase
MSQAERPGHVDVSGASGGVSVVVPAYNVGRYIERCVESLVTQTLDRSRFEIIIVDDGSTDGTAERVDRAAAEHPDLVRVLHIPNSGWPGRPRNLGTDMAVHDYVFYCDADDWLMPYALEVLTDRAAEDGSDVVLSRSIGNRRAVPVALYERGDYCTDWRRTPGVFNNLTTQKMLRRDFLREHGIRFAEGKVRLEDFIFMTQVYLQAEKISIIGTRSCYVFERRDDGGHLTDTVASEEDYFGSVEKIIDIILAHTEPGRDQDVALDRIVRSELIGSLSRASFLRKDENVRLEALGLAQRLLRDRVPPSAVQRLDAVTRRRAAAIVAGDQAQIERIISVETQVSAEMVCTAVTWESGVLRIDLSLALLLDDKDVRLVREGDQLFVPPELDTSTSKADRTDMTAGYRATGVHVRLLSRDITEVWRVRAKVTPVVAEGDDGVALRWTATATVDFATIAGDRPLRPGLWNAHVYLSSCGFIRDARVQLPPGAEPVEPATVEIGAQRVRPFWTPRNELSFSIRSTSFGRASGSGGQKVSKRALRGTWQRRAMAVARRAGLKVDEVLPGAALVSRKAEFDVDAVSVGGTYLVSKRRRQSVRKTVKLRAEVVVVSDSPDVQVLTKQRVDDQHWIVKAAPSAGMPLELAPIGSRGWLVTRSDESPLADITLENQTLQHLAGRHVAWLLRRYDVDYVIDVGANTGQYAEGLRRTGYHGPIASFEPVPEFADTLAQKAAHDDLWTAHPMALGSTEGTVPIRVQRSFSSVLPASAYGKERFATLRDFAEKETTIDVPLRRLDSMLGEVIGSVTRADGGRPRVFLKMGTQGFDLEVFGGLGEWRDDVVVLQSEGALLRIYEGMPNMRESVDVYEAAGFEVSGLYPVTTEPDGRVIEYDCVLVRADRAR